MNEPNSIESLIGRFLEDRDGLSDEEFRRLIEALRSKPPLAEALKDHLMIEEQLAQQFDKKRQDFSAKFERRGKGRRQNRVSIDLKSLESARSRRMPSAVPTRLKSAPTDRPRARVCRLSRKKSRPRRPCRPNPRSLVGRRRMIPDILGERSSP
jgi:hypothetical protein